MEVSPGVFNFSQTYDKVIPRFHARGFRIMTGPEHTAPSWFNGTDPRDPRFASGTTRLFGALARAYDAYDVLWEFTNEPNNNEI